MRNSAWYYKLWLKKLSKLPLKEDAGSAWAGMKDMLDIQMPVSSAGSNSDGSNNDGSNGGAANGSGGTVATKPFAAKLVSLLGYTLPVAAAIGVTTYLVSTVFIKPENVVVLKKRQSHSSVDTVNSKNLPVFADSLRNTDTVKNSSLPVGDLSEDLTKAKPEIYHVYNKSADVKVGTSLKTENDKSKSYTINNQSGTDQNKAMGNITDRDQVAVRKKITEEENVTGESKATEGKLTGKEKVKAGKTIRNPSATGKNSAAKTRSSKKIKISHTPKINEPMTTPAYNFGLESGWNTGKNNGLYVGIFGAYSINTKLIFNLGVRLNTSAALSGSYITKPKGYPGDTLSTYKVSDNRKLMVLNVPLTLEYRLSNKISINAGPVISFPISQSNSNTRSELYKAQLPSTKYLDSARQRTVDSTLNYTKVNKINLSITGGISIRFNQFYIEGKYLRTLTPYKVSNPLGGYQQYNGAFQLGLRYQFKR